MAPAHELVEAAVELLLALLPPLLLLVKMSTIATPNVRPRVAQPMHASAKASTCAHDGAYTPQAMVASERICTRGRLPDLPATILVLLFAVGLAAS